MPDGVLSERGIEAADYGSPEVRIKTDSANAEVRGLKPDKTKCLFQRALQRPGRGASIRNSCAKAALWEADAAEDENGNARSVAIADRVKHQQTQESARSASTSGAGV